MSLKFIVIFLGLAIALMPHLGFPEDMRRIFFTSAGLLIATAVFFAQTKFCAVCKEIISDVYKKKEKKEAEQKRVSEIITLSKQKSSI